MVIAKIFPDINGKKRQMGNRWLSVDEISDYLGVS